MKRICIITPSLAGGGAEKIAVNLANHYSELGHDVTLLAFIGTGPYVNQISSKVNFVDLKVSRIRYAFFKLFLYIRKSKPDSILSVIRASNIMLGFVCFLFKPNRVVLREANTMDNLLLVNTINCFILKKFMQVAYSKADLIIANSKDTMSDLVKHGIIKKKVLSKLEIQCCQ